MTEDWYKHRAWDTLNKVMHYEFEWMTVKDKDELVFQSDISPFPWGQWPPEYDFELGQFVLMECIKVKDKNGRRIFFTDLVKVTNVEPEFVGVVIFNNGGCPYATDRIGQFKYFDNEEAVFEVVGNLYETPELATHIPIEQNIEFVKND